MKSICYSALHKNSDIVKKSSSGGAFSAIVSIWFKMHPDGYVCGSIMDQSLSCYHVIVSNENDCSMMRGSKYVSSKLNSCINEISELLDKGYHVLFTGTPCQVYSVLKNTEKKD